MKKKELKLEIEYLLQRLGAFKRSERILLAQLEQMRLERDDAIQKCQAEALVMDEQAGHRPQVDREVRIGGEEEAQEEKEEERLISALSTLYDSTRGNTTDGDQENTERPDDTSGSGVNPQRSYETGEFDARYVGGSYPIYGQPEGFSVGLWSRSDRAQRQNAERQAGIIAGDGERERTD